MKNTVIILKVLFVATGVTAAVIDTIEDTEFDEVLREEVIFDHRNSTKGRNIPGGKSLDGMNFRAPCDWGNGGQQYWPHPTECNKFVQCGPRGPMEKTCQGNLEWSQSITTCDHPENTDVGQSPIKEDASCQCGLVNVPSQQVNGRKEIPTKRIIGGTEVSHARKYPWQVGLYVEGVVGFDCGGSIISDRWIITAAHCIVEDIIDKTKYIYKCRTYDPSDKVEVWVGDHDQFTTCDDVTDTNKYSVRQYLPHKDYKCMSKNPGNDINMFALYDIALLELNNPIDFTNLIRPICLPTLTSNIDLHVGDIGTVTGWGAIKNKQVEKDKNVISSFLKEVQLEILGNDKCGKRKPSPLTPSKICAASKSNGVGDIGHCGGDSGGPLSVIKNNTHVLVGVVSSSKEFECGNPDYPGLYTRVAHPEILQWITGYLTKSSCP